MRWIAGLVALALLAPGCEQDVALQGRIELGELVRLDLPADEAVGSIGLIDGWVLVLSYRDVISPPLEWGPSAIDLYVRWLSPENVLGEPIYAGRALGSHRSPRWVREGDALTGPLWATWDPSGPPGDARTYIRMASYRPGESAAACELTPELPVAVDPEQGALVMWTWLQAIAGPSGVEPAARVDGRAFSFGHYLPNSCSPPYAVSGGALILASCTAAPETSSWNEDPCLPDTAEEAVATIWAVELTRGVGLLYRSPSSLVPLQWVRLEPDFTPVSGPTTVGRLSHGTGGSGHQPRGVLAGRSVVFSEREEYEQSCMLVRLMDIDGRRQRDAPWQLPCRHLRVVRDFTETSVRLHPFLELHAVNDAAAAIVFIDAPNNRLDDVDPAVAIVALALDPDGRRATELVELASSDASPVAFVRTANDGSALVAAYFDEAPSRDGYWLRRFEYLPDLG